MRFSSKTIYRVTSRCCLVSHGSLPTCAQNTICFLFAAGTMKHCRFTFLFLLEPAYVYVCVFVSRGVGGCEQQSRYIHIRLHIPLHTYTNVHRQTTSYMHIGHLSRLIVQVLPFSICQPTLLLHFLALLLALLDLIFSIESQPPGNIPVRS